MAREDLDYFFDSLHCPPTSHYDLVNFYCAEEIEAWQECSEEENEPEQEMVEEFILKDFSRVPKNDPCPCGSGKKFKKCHLPWAEQERARRGEEDIKGKSRHQGEAHESGKENPICRESRKIY